MKILVITELRQGKWNNASFETLAAAQQIAKDTSSVISAQSSLAKVFPPSPKN